MGLFSRATVETLDQMIERKEAALSLINIDRDRKCYTMHLLHKLLTDPEVTGTALSKVTNMYRHELFHDDEQERRADQLAIEIAELRKQLK